MAVFGAAHAKILKPSGNSPMKYMGSKRWMLSNGLGELLDEKAPGANRFVDLFSGSAAVSNFVATRHEVPVIATDLQAYSRILSAAVLIRTSPLTAAGVWGRWSRRACEKIAQVRNVPDVSKITRATVSVARVWCGARRGSFITRAYGGHYFSPKQALWLDAFHATLPRKEPDRTVALAALIDVAAQCAAAPGHTAQPFQPTRSAKPFLRDSWRRDVPSRLRQTFIGICAQHALIRGKAHVADALEFAKTLRKGDLVFVDPPYSAVHYSRFYHVLEAIAHGKAGVVSGTGRYPPDAARPKSDFSYVSRSRDALDSLLEGIAGRQASAIVTFPIHQCSNGLSGNDVTTIASKYFSVKKKSVSSRLSSLGGTSGESASGSERAARMHAEELILYLEPRR